jgi:uncharacterized membrane protein
MREHAEDATYLAELRRRLRWLDAAERDEVVAEIQSHIAEAQARGESLPTILDRLGAPERLARSYNAGALIEDGRDGFALLSRRWLAASALMLTTSIVSVILVPMLVVLAIGLSLGGALGLGLGMATFFVPELAQSRVIDPPPPAGQIALVAVSVTLIGLGRLSLVVLRGYLRLVVRSIRGGPVGLPHVTAP